ncbi:MAG: efflux transporter outer membrane subunit [Desulfosarcinaceae bacterium]|nr:efflux transporter outer membrane subunit [Desulfosarcinaceae bacterium]
MHPHGRRPGRRPNHHLAVIFGLCLFITACTPFTPVSRTAPQGRLPESYSLYEGGAATPEHWWRTFASTELDGLVDTALAENLGLAAAWARLEQAGALARQSAADLWPQVDAEAGAGVSRRQTDNRGTRDSEDYSLGLISSYEVDLWGRLRAARTADLLEATASREDLYTAAMSVAASVVERWAEIIASRRQLDLLQEQLEVNRTFLDLVELRFEKGIVSALDVYQQRQAVAEVEAEIPLVEASEQLLRHELALLLGKPPGTVFEILETEMPLPPALPALGLPADLLAARPDVRAAGLRLRAADWQVAAARANRLPALRLTAGASYGSDDLDRLFDNWLLNLAANLTAPLLDGGRRTAAVERQAAVAAENLVRYRETVLIAVKEVEDALVREVKQRQHLAGLQRQIDVADKALEQAVERYRKGLNDYLPVLTQLASTQRLARDLITQQTALIRFRIALHRALGGRWTEDLSAPPL